MASNSPTSMAMVRSNTTVRINVVSKTASVPPDCLTSERNVRHSLMLYATTTSTPARQAIGICLVRSPKNNRISNRTTACITPATGERPPLLMLVIVRAMAPVAGIPPKNGVTMLATPCATSSMFELCRLPITPSATVADNRDSIAPSMAMVNAEGNSMRMLSRLNPIGFAWGS